MPGELARESQFLRDQIHKNLETGVDFPAIWSLCFTLIHCDSTLGKNMKVLALHLSFLPVLELPQLSS